MTEFSKSPERGSFQSKKYRKILEEDPSNTEALAMVEMSASWRDQEEQQRLDPKWQKDNMEYDMCTSEWMCEKVRASKVYSQNLYAAMCNRDFQKLDVIPILSDKKWSCSWRYAGGIVANMRQEGDYIEWYCSGIRELGDMDDDQFQALTNEQRDAYIQTKQYVGEGVVTAEIEQDLKKLGWIVLPE